MRGLGNGRTCSWAVLLVLSACIGVFSGCGGGGGSSGGDAKGQSQSEEGLSGTVAAQLFFIPDQPEGLNTLAYEITGTGIDRIAGTVAITSNSLTATIPAVPAGTGLTMTLASADGTCAGQATFDVLAGQTTTPMISQGSASLRAYHIPKPARAMDVRPT